MSSPKQTHGNLKAGHPKAVIAGGMRIIQHKTHKESDGINEDITGLKVSGSPPKIVIPGAKGNADFPPEAVQNIHKEKPPANFAPKHQSIIHQPRK